MSEQEPEEDVATLDFIDVLQNSLWISSPEYAGWLQKKSSNWFVNKSLLLRGHAWAWKWVSLHGTELVYMDKEPNLETMSKIKIRRSQITASTSITSDENEPTQFSVNFNIDRVPEWLFRAESVEAKTNWMIKLNQVHAITVWLDEYDRVKVLGVGGQGTVYELVHRVTGKHLAMKEMEIKSEKQMQLAISEAVFLKKIVESVSHPNLMRIEKVFQVGSKFYLAFPLCTGGELYDAVVSRGHFSEHDAAGIIHDLISALHALHQHDILHLDIKPENILYESKDINAKIMLTDFGLSKLFKEDELKTDTETFRKNFQKHLELYINDGDLENSQIRGTNGYISPEIIVDGYYSKAADVFAAGVVLYILLCGYPPFFSRSTRLTFLRTVKGHYKMDGAEWDSVSEEAKDLVRKMLIVDPFARITTGEILQHPWIVAAGPFAEPAEIDFSSTKEEPLILRSPLSTIPEEVESTTEQLSTLSIPSVVATTTSIVEPAVTTPVSVPTPASDGAQSPFKKQSSLFHENRLTTLSQLANHVQYLKSEKMAATMTKLFSLSSREVGHSRLADKYLISLHPDGFTQEERKELEKVPIENVAFLISDEMRQAISSVIFESFGSNKNYVTIEEFGIIRRKLGFLPHNPNSIAATNVNIGELLLARLMDRNNDGYITNEDIYNFQVLLMHRNEVYLQTVFRVYTEALWYPGRNINYLNTVQHMNLRGKPLSASVAGASTPNVDAIQSTEDEQSTVEAGEITGSGVGDRLSSRRRSSKGHEEKYDVVDPPKVITAKHVAAVFEKFGYDPKHAETVFNVLCETLQRIRLGAKPIPETPHISPQEQKDNNNKEETEPDDELSLKNVKRHRMDVNDFIRACRIDDILVQVLYRQQHQRLYHLIEKAKRKYAEEKEAQSKLPAEQRKEISLEAIVHDIVQKTIADKIAV